jgi:YggT family protein
VRRWQPCAARAAWLGSARPERAEPAGATARPALANDTDPAKMPPFADFIVTVLQIYIYVLIVQVVLSWLIAFNVLNTRNRFVYQIAEIAYKLTEPALRPIRRIIPSVGGLDLSPIVLILLIGLIQRLVAWYLPY